MTQLISQAQVSGLSSALAGVSGDLTANWSTSNTNVVINGDSIAARMGTKFADLAGVTGVANCYNTGAAGRQIFQVAGSYNAEARQYRSGINGITTAWMFLLDGGGGVINDVSAGSDSATYISQLQTFITTLLADNWKIGLVTCHWGAGFYQQGTATFVTPTQARYVNEINRWILQQRGLNPNVIVVSAHDIISGPNDPLNNTDKIHLSNGGGEDGEQRLAEQIYATLKSGAGGQLPFLGMRGVNVDDVATHFNIQLTPHTYLGAAQVDAPIGLAYSSNLTWDVSLYSNAVVVLTGNITITPTNQSSNGIYSMKIKPNGHTVTFNATKYPPNAEMPSGGKETDSSGTSGVIYDHWRFVSDGTYLQRERRLIMDSTRPISSGALLEDYFLSDGVQESMSGRLPDTQAVSTNTWITDGPAVVSTIGNYLTGTNGVTNNNARYNIAIHDGYSAEWDMTELPEGGSGTDNTIGMLFLFRFDPTQNPKTNACMGLKVSSDGAHTPHFVWYANGYLADAGSEIAGSGTSMALNDHIKVTVNGSALQMIRTPSGGSPTTLISTSSSNGNTSGKNGVGFDLGVNTGGSNGNTFFSNGPVQHLLVKTFP